MSRDPLEYRPLGKKRKPIDPKRLHKYLYAGGDPVNLEDPSGDGFVENVLVGVLTFSFLVENPNEAILPHIEVDIEYVLEEVEALVEKQSQGPGPE
jgi:hypothetical protein